MTEAEALKQVTRARTSLIYEQPFFGVLCLNLEIIISYMFPTLATDMRRLIVNPDCIAKMSHKELVFAIAHEVLHCVFFHPARRGTRDPKLWNIAADYVINAHLKNAGFTLPTWVYYDPQYDGLTAEEVYRLLVQKQEEQKKKQQQQEQQQQEQQQSEDDSDQSESEEQDDSGDDEQDSDGSSEDDGSDQGASDGQAQDDTEGSGSGSGQGEESSGQDGQGTGEGSGTGTGAGAPGDEQSGSGGLPLNADGKLEDVLIDAAPDNPGKAAEIQNDWDAMKKMAVNTARANGIGKLPGWLEGIASASSTSVIDWREEMRRFVSPSSTKRRSWSRPSRRLSNMPGTVVDGVAHVVWVRDTSGSMNLPALEACNAELQAALDEGVIDRLTVIDCDAEVRCVVEYGRGDQIECNVRGRGGTRFSPAFEWIEENAFDANAIVYFSDMEVNDYGDEPTAPVLFCGYGDPRELRKWADRRPFGDFVEVTW